MNTRLSRWLCGSTEWSEFESYHEERKLTLGRGTVAFHHYLMDRVLYERNILRSYNEKMDFWKIDRLDGRTSLVMSPLRGTFWQNKGSFLSTGLLNGRSVTVWVEWTRICDNYACWEQALSCDRGRTWETNWVMEFFRK